MAKNVKCTTHGESRAVFVCAHLAGESVGLGFHCEQPSADDPVPDAWCDDCQIIFQAHGGWTEQAEKLMKPSVICAGCYERARIRNVRPSVTLGDLKDLRWKCGTCDEWHHGPCLDLGFDEPIYWSRPATDNADGGDFLDPDFCAVGGSFFVRGLIHLPIIGTAETFRWGVWGSLSQQNFETLRRMDDDPKGAELPAMFSWLSNNIPEYPDTLSLKMYAHIQPSGQRPHFELERTEHPLSVEFHHGILPQRVKEITVRRMRGGQGN